MFDYCYKASPDCNFSLMSKLPDLGDEGCIPNSAKTILTSDGGDMSGDMS